MCAFVGRVGCEGMCEGYLCEFHVQVIRVRVSVCPVCPGSPQCLRLQLLASFPPVRGLVFVGSGCGGPGGPGAAPLFGWGVLI